MPCSCFTRSNSAMNSGGKMSLDAADPGPRRAASRTWLPSARSSSRCGLVEIDGEDANVDGLDDVFVELLQPLVLGDLLLERGVETRILNGDANVAGERFEQLKSSVERNRRRWCGPVPTPQWCAAAAYREGSSSDRVGGPRRALGALM